MKLPAVLKIVSFVSLAFAGSCGPLGGNSGKNHRIVSVPGLSELGSKLFAASNAYRVRSGKGRLSRKEDLDRLAQQHSESMARRGKLDHAGASFRTDEIAARYGIREKAENVMRWHVKAGRNAQTMVQQWIDSPAHRRNLLGPYAISGLGIVQDEQGNIWVTQIYAPAPGAGQHGPTPGRYW